MTYAINDNFNDPLGRWTQVAPWDSTEYFDSSKAFIGTQSHVDIRSFRVITEYDSRPQSDLEASVLDNWDSPVVEQTLERKLSSTINEPWSLTGTGLSNVSVGAQASRGGWPAYVMQTTGAAVSSVLTSSMPGDNLNISTMDFVELVIPDYNAFDGTSSIQLTSDPNGVFGNGFDSTAVVFSTNASVMPLLKLAIAGFAHAGFDSSKVTGVKISLVKAAAPAASQTVSLLALRAVKTAWVNSALDFDTRLGGLVVPITDAGIVYGGSTAVNFEFIRGDLTQNDPIPANSAFNIYFAPGGQTSPNDATGSAYNEVGLLFREQKNTSAGTGSFMEGYLKFNDAGTSFICRRVNMTGGAGGTRTTVFTATQTVGGPLDPTRHFLFRLEVVGTSVQPKLYHTDYNGTIQDTVWSGLPVNNANLAYRPGRVGFRANLVSRDSYVLNYEAAPTGYAVFQTKPAVSFTPVDGVRLAANYADDENLFATFGGPDLSFDSSKTISGNGAWRASQQITSNQFIVDDWNHTYLRAKIWVGAAGSLVQPQILLNGSASLPIRVPALGPNQWNDVYVDLSRFFNQITGTPYTIVIQPDPSAVVGLGTFWVDDMMIGRRQVAWAARATTTGHWREFRGAINDARAGLHFNVDERGTQLQIQATALTPSAWIAVGGGMKVWPRYAELGCPVYDTSAKV